jgi:hypothetical protein
VRTDRVDRIVNHRAHRYGLVALVTLACAAGLPISGAHAQGVRGVVRDSATAAPLPGVLVSVLDVDDERVRGVLTDANGGFTIEVPLGRYRLRAERIGLRAQSTEPFDLNTFNLRFEQILMSDRAVRIEGLVVDARVQSCRLDPRQAERIQRWWLEIRTALDVSAVLQREQFGQFLVERFEREWDRRLRRVIGANRTIEVSTSTRPFVAEDAEVLAERGYVRGEAGTPRQYYGPDADVLLSSLFLSQHCFSLVEDRDRVHQIGLRFEPTEDREPTDIEGTLWVDTTTAELQQLDFRYANLDGPQAGDAGGMIAFDYLDSGAWIVSDWYIRMPKVRRVGISRRGFRTVGYYDGGGSVTTLDPPEPGGATGTVRGFVRDSLRGGGLADAVVSILGTARRTPTGADGAFQFLEVPEGRHYLAFAHDEIDIWGLGTGYVQVDVRAGETADVALGVPSFERAALALCLADGVDAETLVVGHVLGPNREPMVDRFVQLAFEGRRGEALLAARTDERGRFVQCALPADTGVTLRLEVRGEWVDIADFVAGEHQLTYREVWFTR